ncbi:hypothetical protein [Enterococcus faecalis]|uniref:Uncharacterized protein n=1 Tax=Enterococcus faecalis RP2S-4 TaxID=1244145 RepID=A0ABC9TQ81_ENTFL|nr:hypothetical protein [Enterococcus faecalis]EPI11781.1 hypothetical protein D358_00194 [Enterococcus faecalis RP2S-4]
MKVLLTEHYPWEQVNVKSVNQFLDRLAEYFGDTRPSTIKIKEVVESDELLWKVNAQFAPGYPVQVRLERNIEAEEVTCTAYQQFHPEYSKKLTEADYELLCTLVVQKSLSSMRIPGQAPLTEEEQLLDEQLSYLIPKLMIITGKATEDNFTKG